MNIKKYLFPVLLIGTTLALIFRASARTAFANPISTGDAYNEIDTYVEQQRRRLNLPGISLVIVKGDQIVHYHGFGQSRPDGETPSPQTPFFIGSTTKSFTALGVMQLVETGKIDLDAPIRYYLPWFTLADPQAASQITVRHLLNQTGGLPLSPGWQQLADFDDSPGATERQARALSTVEPKHQPGSVFEYSNVNYNLLGLIIEAASGESYADYVQNHIFDPLGMSHSYTSKEVAKQDGLAVGHQTWFGIPVPAPDLSVPSGSLPSGQLISSAEDMGHYLIAHLNEGSYAGKQVLSPGGVVELHRPAVEAPTLDSTGHYGMGWYIEGQGRTKIVHHTGMIPDFFTFMALLPEQKKGVVLLINVNHFMNELTLTEVGAGVTSLLAGNQPPPIRFGAIPWVIRSLLLIPLLQVIGVVSTLRLLARWRRDPALRPSQGRVWGMHILPSMLLNLIPIVSALALLTSGLCGFFLLFMPDLSWLAMISGSFALFWTFLRTILILRTTAKTSTSKTPILQVSKI